MLLNLLSNAIRFSKKGKKITVTAKLKLKTYTEGHVKIKVKDNGIGIKSKDIQNLFLPFGNQKKISKLNPSGMGLGLSICKRVCKSLNGDISVKS